MQTNNNSQHIKEEQILMVIMFLLIGICTPSAAIISAQTPSPQNVRVPFRSSVGCCPRSIPFVCPIVVRVPFRSSVGLLSAFHSVRLSDCCPRSIPFVCRFTVRVPFRSSVNFYPRSIPFLRKTKVLMY